MVVGSDAEQWCVTVSLCSRKTEFSGDFSSGYMETLVRRCPEGFRLQPRYSRYFVAFLGQLWLYTKIWTLCLRICGSTDFGD